MNLPLNLNEDSDWFLNKFLLDHNFSFVVLESARDCRTQIIGSNTPRAPQSLTQSHMFKCENKECQREQQAAQVDIKTGQNREPSLG